MTPNRGDKAPGSSPGPFRVPEKDAELVLVGRIGKPHGVRGEVSVHSHAQSPELFDHLEEVHLLARDGSVRTYALKSWRPHGKGVLLTLAGVEDRDQAALLTGQDLAVNEADLPEPEEDEVYLHDLLGLEVRDAEGAVLGRFEHFLETAEHDVWVIEHPSGKEILLPAVEEVIQEIDLDAGTITVDPPDGLLDLYLNDEPAKD